MIPAAGLQRSQAFYDWLLSEIRGCSAVAEDVLIGLVWTICHSRDGVGLAMSPQAYSRTLDWPGTLAGRSLAELGAGIRSWEPFEATVAMAAINAAINGEIHAPGRPGISAFDDVVELPHAGGNLAVFEHFLPRIRGARIVVVGRYPGLENYEKQYDIQVIERHPGPNDYPESAAETLIPEADWVFLTSSSIINKTFPRLSELARHASVVLVGPTTPCLPGLAAWGVDYLAVTVVRDAPLLQRCVAEAGGKAIFDGAVQYVVADIGRPRMQAVKEEIADLAASRDRLKRDMDAWYGEARHGRFPHLAEYEQSLAALSVLDTQYKWMWDARNPACRSGVKDAD